MINFRLFIPILLLPLILIGIYSSLGFPENRIFFITNCLILIFSFLGMFMDSLKLYSLVKVVFIFIFIFFGLVPLIHQVDNSVIYGNELDIGDKIKANFIILIGMIFFIAGSYLKASFFDKLVNSLPEIKKLNIFYIIIFFLISLLILYKWNFDLNLLIFRGIGQDYSDHLIFNNTIDTNFSPKTSYHFYTKFIRPMPIILLVIFVYFYKKNLKSYNNKQKLIYSTLFLVILLISLLLNFSTGIDRLQTAVFYIPFIIIFTKLWEKPFMMQLTLLGGILTVFEFLDKFRKFNLQEFNFKVDMNFLKKGHFDAYENFVRAIEIDFITYGYQLKGALLFFIPRFLWKDKPIGSGSTLANQLDYNFGGIAMPFIGEGYVNYGSAGSFLFMLLLGIILGNLDRMAWSLKNSNKDCLFLYYYYFLFGLVFYFMRGDLINSVAFISAITASFWVLVLLLKYVAKLRI